MQKYRQRLSRYGIESRVVHSVQELNRARPTLVHLMNVDLPLENLRYAGWCSANDVPYVVSAIHHPDPGKRAYYELARGDRFNEAVRVAGVDFEHATVIREAAKLGLRGRVGGLANAHRKYTDLQQELLSGASRVQAMTEAEAVAVSAKGAHRVDMVPNGFTFPRSGPTQEKRTGAVFVGRIEPRKNQVAAAAILRELPFPVTFVGAINGNHPRYHRRFRAIVASSPNLRFEPARPQGELKGLYASCRLSINVSWYEVVSQVDLEAAALGCGVASSIYSYLSDCLTGYTVVSPVCLGSAACRVAEQLERSYREAVVPDVRAGACLGWDDTVEMLVDSYRKV